MNTGRWHLGTRHAAAEAHESVRPDEIGSDIICPKGTTMLFRPRWLDTAYAVLPKVLVGWQKVTEMMARSDGVIQGSMDKR